MSGISPPKRKGSPGGRKSGGGGPPSYDAATGSPLQYFYFDPQVANDLTEDQDEDWQDLNLFVPASLIEHEDEKVCQRAPHLRHRFPPPFAFPRPPPWHRHGRLHPPTRPPPRPPPRRQAEALLRLPSNEVVRVRSTGLQKVEAQEMEGVGDILHLNNFSEMSLIHTLRTRYHQDHIYTWVGPILVAINPYVT